MDEAPFCRTVPPVGRTSRLPPFGGTSRLPMRGGGEGWIRTSVGRSPADLQSAAFNHSATSPGARQAAQMATQAGAVNRRCPWRSLIVAESQSRRFPRIGSGSARSKFHQSPGLPEFGAGEGNRTLVVSLEGFCSTIELHPPIGVRPAAFAIPPGIPSMARDRPSDAAVQLISLTIARRPIGD